MKIQIPSDVEYMLNALVKNGFEAYVVGGCMRDIILKKTPKDWDLVTNASIDEIQSVFTKTFEVGVKHGTVLVPIHGVNYEVSTFRGEQDKERNIFLDLAKRDFTMNAIAYSPMQGLLDPFDGMGDIQKKCIRGVKNPEERFSEDPLRMLRAVRFSAQLDFEIEEKTQKVIVEDAQKICSISAERIREELSKILMMNPKKLLLLRDVGLLKYLLPEYDQCFGVEQNHPYHIYDVGEHILLSILNSEKNAIIRWTMLLHDLGKPQAKILGEDGYNHFYGHQEISSKIGIKMMERLKFDNESIRVITTLIEYHDYRLETNKKSLRKILFKIGKEMVVLLLQVQYADRLAQNLKYSGDMYDNQAKIRILLQEIEEDKDCVCLKDLALDGKDLILLGMKPSKEMGRVLENLLELVLDQPQKNTREQLQLEALKLIKNLQL